MNPRWVRYDADAALDAVGFACAPASLLVRISTGPGQRRSVRLFAAGHPDAVAAAQDRRGRYGTEVEVVSLPGRLLLPGLVNAHTHLDLTHVGPQPHDAREGFAAWIEKVRQWRSADAAVIEASVRRGVELSLAGGTVAVGDIAGAAAGQPRLEPWRVLRGSPLAGVSFIEFFAMGKGEARGIAALTRVCEEAAAESHRPGSGRPHAVRLGIQPHAPYTVSPAAYRAAAAVADRYGCQISTHLAESPEEREFVTRATGPQRELLERLGLWDDSEPPPVGRGDHPIDHVLDALSNLPTHPSRPGLMAVHLNDTRDTHIGRLARAGTRVVYCPRASRAFGAHEHFGPHRYLDMLDAGIPVALGTDSIITLPSNAASSESGGISVFDEMRHLFGLSQSAASQTSRSAQQPDPLTLLAMATLHGATALGLPTAAFTFAPAFVDEGGAFGETLQHGHPIAGIVAVTLFSSKPADASSALGDALTVSQRANARREPTPALRLLCIGNDYGPAEIVEPGAAGGLPFA